MALVLHKKFNCAVNKTTNTGHTTNINYTLILMMILIGHGPSLWKQPCELNLVFSKIDLFIPPTSQFKTVQH